MKAVHLHTDASPHPSLYVRILCHRGHDPISACNRSYSYTPPSTVYTKDRIWTEVTHCPVLSCRSPMVKRTHKGVTKQRCSKPTCRKISHTHTSVATSTDIAPALVVICAGPFVCVYMHVTNDVVTCPHKPRHLILPAAGIGHALLRPRVSRCLM